MRRSFGLQQQSYEVQVQQQSYASAVEAAGWHVLKNHHYDNNQFSGMEVMPAGSWIDHSLLHRNKISRNHGLHQNGSWHHVQDEHRVGQASWPPISVRNGWCGTSTGENGWNATKFSNNGAIITNENAEYQTFHEARVPATMIVQETRYYERSGWGDKGGYGKSEWVPRGL